MVSETSQGVKSYSNYPYVQITSNEVEKMGFDWFFRNDIPKTLSDGVYILNLDSKGNQGSHWSCFCLKHPNIYYVDSFGTDINGYPPQELREFGKNNGFTTIYANEWDIQHIKSWLCGWYALYFASKMKKYFNQLNPKNFDNIIHKGYSKYPSEQNVNLITDWGKKMGIM